MKAVRVAFRVDASLDIGTGHVMRCLTLADALRRRGAECSFVSRPRPGDLIDAVRERGYPVHAMPKDAAGADGANARLPAHAAWVGADPETDAKQTLAALAATPLDWLVVDHYGLDAAWERRVRPGCRRMFVIDDLADRPHACDALLDQNLGRQPHDYAPWVGPDTRLFVGPSYGLLRPDFALLRAASLARRETAPVRRLLVAMGGVDKADATGRTLAALRHAELPADTCIDVVMGAHAPWLQQVRGMASQMPWRTEVRVNAADMAQIMAGADLAIGAAGTTAWERCCLGVPTLTWILADNQQPGAVALQAAGCVELLPREPNLPGDLLRGLRSMVEPARLRAMQMACAAVTEGEGAERIAAMLVEQQQ